MKKDACNGWWPMVLLMWTPYSIADMTRTCSGR
jgi:hypothetical protein